MANKKAASFQALKISGLVELPPSALLGTNGGRGRPTGTTRTPSATALPWWSYFTQPHRIWS